MSDVKVGGRPQPPVFAVYNGLRTAAYRLRDPGVRGNDAPVASRVLVTGMGVISAAGHGPKAFWDSLTAGRTAVSRISSFDTTELGRHHAAEIKDFRARDFLTAAEARRTGRCSAYTLAAARMATVDARLGPASVEQSRFAVVIGTTMGEAQDMERLEHAWLQKGAAAVKTPASSQVVARCGWNLLPIHIARSLGAGANLITLPGACAAGNYAIGLGADLIRTGRADVVLAGGVEIVQQLQFAGFVRLGAIAPERCQPFDKNRQGLIMGEGCGILVLESEEHAVRRGADALAEFGGYGLACDAYHITRPHPEGTGTVAATRRALQESGIGPEEVDFINAHGTATHANDLIEAKATREVFGDREVPLSSIKSMIGHAMGASSALEAVACVLTVKTGVYPPTIGYESPDPECRVHIVANEARKGPADVVINNSLAFGGYDAVSVFARVGRLPARELRA